MLLAAAARKAYKISGLGACHVHIQASNNIRAWASLLARVAAAAVVDLNVNLNAAERGAGGSH